MSTGNRECVVTASLATMIQAEKRSVSDQDRDCAITVRAFELATSGPFDRIVRVDGSHAPDRGANAKECLGVLSRAGIDRKHQTRLCVLDSRWFSLCSDDDTATRESTVAAMGVGPSPMSVQWASSAVFACADTASLAEARGRVSDWLALERVALHSAVEADKDMHRQIQREAQQFRERLDDMVRQCYKHIIYLAPKGDYGSSVEFLRLGNATHSALNGSDVWEELAERRKTFSPSEFDGKALLHYLRDIDYECPISDVRDGFWFSPHKPLLPGGVAELVGAIYDAVASGHIKLIGADGIARTVRRSDDIDPTAGNLRLRRAV